MTGLERILAAFEGRPVDRLPVLPMMHAGLAEHAGVDLGRYYADASAMASVMIDGARRFGFDGVQLSLGVIGEAESLGAKTDFPPGASPVLKEMLLADESAGRMDELRMIDVTVGGRMPLYFSALRQVVDAIGQKVFVLNTLRGPLVAASQLRGVEQILIDMIEAPKKVEAILDFTTDVTLTVARASLELGTHGVLLGEATCSPNFISPVFYRQIVKPHHTRMVDSLHEMGWRRVGWHICGDIVPIVEDMIETGADFIDVDYQVDAGQLVRQVNDRVAMRGNLDPSSVLRFGTPKRVREATVAVRDAVAGSRWIMGSGCDVPPGTPADNLHAMVEALRDR